MSSVERSVKNKPRAMPTSACAGRTCVPHSPPIHMSSDLLAPAQYSAFAQRITSTSLIPRNRVEKSASFLYPKTCSIVSCSLVATTAPSWLAAVNATSSDERALFCVPRLVVLPSGSHKT